MVEEQLDYRSKPGLHYIIASCLELWLTSDSKGNKFTFCSSCFLAAAIQSQAADNVVAAEPQVVHTGFNLIVKSQFIASYNLRIDS